MSTHLYFVANDGNGDTTLWRNTGPSPIALLRKCDLPEAALYLWATFVEAVVSGEHA